MPALLACGHLCRQRWYIEVLIHSHPPRHDGCTTGDEMLFGPPRELIKIRTTKIQQKDGFVRLQPAFGSPG
jgi:hypothetical protein